MEKNLKKYHEAAVAYVGLGVVIVLLTAFFVPSNHYRSGFVPLLIGIAILLVISFFVYKGVSWLTRFLSVLAGGRTFWWAYSFFAFGDESSSWVYVACGAINLLIFYMLARAGWDLGNKSNNISKTGLKEAVA